MQTRSQAGEAKKANARPPLDNDSHRKVRPRLNGVDNDSNYFYFKDSVNHDHDYFVTYLKPTEKDYHEATAVVPKVHFGSHAAISNTKDEMKDVAISNSDDEMKDVAISNTKNEMKEKTECVSEKFSKNAVDALLENIENDLNQINKNDADNPRIKTTAVSTQQLQSTTISSKEAPVSPSFSKRNDDSVRIGKIQRSPIQTINGIINGNNVTSIPFMGRSSLATPSRISTFFSESPWISGGGKSTPALLKRDENISKLEDNIEMKCNSAIDAIEDIKNIWSKYGIKSNENMKTMETLRNLPSSSKMNDMNVIRQSPSLLEDEKEETTSISNETTSDDNLPPDVSKFLGNSKVKTETAGAQKSKNDKQALLIARIKLYEQDIKFDMKQLNRRSIKSAKRHGLMQRIRHKMQQIEALKAQLTSNSKVKSSDSDSDSEDQYEDDVFSSEKGILGDILQAFSGTKAATAQGIHNLQDSLSRCPKENEYAEDPIGLTVSLMIHQKKALKWMIFRENEQSCPGGILADDMGLGKTLTMISLIVHTMPLERRKSSRYEVDSADSGDDWDLPSESYTRLTASGKKTCDGGTLVVCPPTLLQQWKNEIHKRTNKGLISVKVHHGHHRTNDAWELCRPDVVITTYNLLHLDSLLLNRVYWKRVVLDEAHQIRNPKTNVSEAACSLKSHKRWAMTGTPVHNKSLDIYSILKFLGCHPWDDLRIWNSTMSGKRTGIVRLTAVLKSLVLRRTKAELQASGEMPPLPAKIVKTIEIELDKSETEVYKTLLAYSRTLFAQFLMQRYRREDRYSWSIDQFIHRAIQNKNNRDLNKDDIPEELFEELNKALLNAKGDIQQCHILVLLLRLRQICDHPALISKMINEEEISQVGMDEDSSTTHGNLFSKDLLTKKSVCGSWEGISKNPLRADNPVFKEEYESSKMKAIIETLEKILPTGDKVIIVSQWTCMLEVVAWHLSQAGETRYEMFTGKVKVSDRQAIVDRFNNPRDDLKILLLSLTAGGVGLNLLGGNNLIMIDNHWNPQLEKQAEDRIYRYGQKKEVSIYKFLCKDTIEERVKELQNRKLQLASDILSGLRPTSTRLTLDDLKQLFQMR